jgi:hypothetical protein
MEDGCHNVTYINHDPRIIEANPPPPPPRPERATESNVYDPRFYGYGTSYRHYIDPVVGQPRFMYSDVDAVRKPNYIGRSNIDHATWAQSYGVIDPNLTACNRELAHDKFLNDALSEREEYQQRYMRKYNNQVAWQRKVAPIHRRGTRM